MSVKDRETEEHKTWLFDLVHNNITEKEILRGFIKFYILNGFVPGDVTDDLHFHTKNSEENIKVAKKSLDIVLNKVANNEELEVKNITEINIEDISADELDM